MTAKVLLVDDDPVALFIMKKMMAKSDFHTQPLAFENGHSALEHIRSSSKSDNYLVFLDINMPEMSGWEFLNALEAFEGYNIFVFIVSSSTDEADKIRSQSSPFVLQFLSKPVSTQTLVSLKDTLADRLIVS